MLVKLDNRSEGWATHIGLMPLGEGHLDLGLARWRVPRRVKGSQSNDMELNHRR